MIGEVALEDKSFADKTEVKCDPLGHCYLLSHDQEAVQAWFEPQVRQWNAKPVTGSGRGSAWFMRIGDREVVLRHYLRGGMVAKLTRDLYVWKGLDKARSIHEYRILWMLSQKGLKVAKPLAAMVTRTRGFFYRAALLTYRIPGAVPLCKFEDGDVWLQAGRTIATMHQIGVWHADLNINNILVDTHAQVWLIDFDRARSGVQDKAFLKGNLQRLERSVLKVCPQAHAGLWEMLLKGYDLGPFELNDPSSG